MKLTDLVTSQDGSLSLTKLAACTFHLNAAIAFAWLTYRDGFSESLWIIYGGYAVGHAVVDKTTQVAKAIKEKQMEGQDAAANP